MKNAPTVQTQAAIRRGANIGKRRRAVVILTFLFAPLLLLFVFTYLPFFDMIRFSFYDRNYLNPGTFVGLKNYIDVFQRDDCFKTLIVSVYYMGGAVVQLALALYFASMMVFKAKGSSIYKACMFFPYLICGIAVGFVFKFFYSRAGVLDSILMLFGMAAEDIPMWLQDTRINNIALAATSVWRYTGQNMVMFLGAMMSVDSSLYEAASLDGANKWQQFKYIIMPSIRTIIVLNLILFLQFFENLPRDLDESGIIDGCGYFGIFFRILFPLLKPAIVTSCVLKGVSIYNEYYMSNLYLTDSKLKTISTALYTFTGPYGSQYNYICAGVLITIIPILVLFLICQKQVYGGMTAGAVKG